MTEVFFYHLQRQPLEKVLPALLERSRERGWRALVKAASPERLQALDDYLWAYRDDSFLPHGLEGDGEAAAEQPVLLTLGDRNPNGAAVLFLVDGAEPPASLEPYSRVAILLDGRDEDAVAAGRGVWTRLKAGGHAVTYWQQDEEGRWRQGA